MRGNISRRGKKSWRLKFDVERDAGGKRKTVYVTVRGKRQDAQRELTRLLAEADAGTLPDPSTTSVAEHLDDWLNGKHGLAPKTAERYKQLSQEQIVPHLGSMRLQKLRPRHVQDWHAKLLVSGGRDGRPLAPRTVGHAHRVLHRALARAVEAEKLSRNVAGNVRPPKVDSDEVVILTEGQIAEVLEKLKRHPLFALAATALATGVRRGELLAIQLRDLDFDGAILQIRHSLEQTKAGGLRFKAPKTKHGRRTITLPAHAVAVLRTHWRQQLEYRLAIGLGKPEPETLIFSEPDGRPLSPDALSWRWRSACKSLRLPRVSFHSLRHSHASALIAAGVDVVQISKRLGHAHPGVTLKQYAHLFKLKDGAAAAAIENVLRTPRER